ncbi:ABC-F family ATP-binding cassette domain-containing protein [Novosphingobium guangzhouense]|uniref:ABC transporter n=1 Tax=Novosphingobium guangzhouense TaxID=1850347 RepID=A0A2K2G397_9SPHN|nr:ABC-F family ATP-binding cassette domain-containing protein [Novosphingobium guangzhouense]PNU05491.1 ABC transporter [Novosphingobium guangzhouense]
MPASISVSNLTWSTPDGGRVLDGVTLDFGRERAGLIGRNGIGKSTLLNLVAGRLVPAKGVVRVQGTIAMLRQTLQVGPDETVADLLGITQALDVLQRAETGTATLDELADADWTVEARAADALAEMGLNVALDRLLTTLSGGQRTRAALAGLTLAAPDFLLLDEPTNNLDADGRAAVYDMLSGWRAGALVVSHDRELLETMDAIVELTSLGATRYGGNWSAYSERKVIELAAAEHDLAVAERHRTQIAQKAQTATERQQRRDAAGSRNAARGGMPRILLGARRERAENSGAENRRLAERQRAEADHALERARARVEVLQPLSMQIAPTGLAPSREVLTLERVCAGHAAGAPVLRDVTLRIVGPERLAVTGANGVGKSTLLQVIVGALAISSGRLERHAACVLLDQGVSILQRGASIVDNFSRLNPGVDDNTCRATLARFGFRGASADRMIQDLSGGQMLRVGLACVLGNPRPPSLLILDEPTNHLDIEAIEAVEAALLAYDGALVVVSHDRRFLDRIGITRTVQLQRPGPTSE